ncbi:MAG: hypothetical protein O6826_02700, partial [Acidobacteria bacterium]|nr:hypothetical protein [Acidobacteriota bacterium]
MKTRFLLGVVVVVGLCLTFPFPSQRVLSFFSEVVQPVYAQGSADTDFWVFDGHLHPWASGYRRGGNWGDPDFS